MSVEDVQREIDERGWSTRDLSAVVAERFECATNTAETWWYRLRSGRRESAEWLERFMVALDLIPQPAGDRPGLDAWCPGCREVVPTLASGCCVWCDEQTGGNTDPLPTPPHRSHAGQPYLMDEATLQEARALYLAGGSFRQVAAAVLERTGYASVRSLANAMCDTWRYRGWATRDRTAVVRARSTIHGLHGDPAHKAALRIARGETQGRRCAGVRSQPPRKGAPCRRYALVGGLYCAGHEPARADERAERLADMRARKDPVAAPIPHGTAGGYTNRGCRCDECTEAQRLALADYRARRRAAA